MVHNGEAKCSAKTLIASIDAKTITEDDSANPKVPSLNLDIKSGISFG